MITSVRPMQDRDTPIKDRTEISHCVSDNSRYFLYPGIVSIGRALIITPKSRKGPIISGPRKVGPNMYDVPIREITRPVP